MAGHLSWETIYEFISSRNHGGTTTTSSLKKILHKQGLMEFIQQNPLSSMITYTSMGTINVAHTIRYDPRSDAVVGVVRSSIFGHTVSMKLATENYKAEEDSR
jgi:hypothetical protein